MLSIGNCIIIDYKDVVRSTQNEVDNIAEHTVNTWQGDRSYAEKRADTELGKFAEDVIITALGKLNIDGYYSYDSFRSDNFKLHAPFDGVLTNNFSQRLVDLVNNGVQNEGSGLSINTREAIRELNAHTVEIKSTRLAQKYKDKAGFIGYNNERSVERLIGSLMGYDFLNYPYYKRSGDMTYDEYCMFVDANYLHTGLGLEELRADIREEELLRSTDIFVRLFMDSVEQKAIIMGWIDRYKFLTPPETQKLPLPGKSERALYFVKALRRGYSLDKLKELI
ncbi:MAG: hypothetical protein K2L88_01510 [Clostridiales bacterium]|nr:hypothetical protein [Clostridiales bacterium]